MKIVKAALALLVLASLVAAVGATLQGQLAQVVVLLLVVVVIGFAGFAIYTRELRFAATKKRIVPKQAYSEPGICQCDDALSYHDQGGCNVPNCHCRRYVDSLMVASEEFKTAIQSAIPRHVAIGSEPRHPGN